MQWQAWARNFVESQPEHKEGAWDFVRKRGRDAIGADVGHVGKDKVYKGKAAKKGKKPLPKKPVLLFFDDAYISYYTFVAPLLEKFGYPSVLPVVGSWIDTPPKQLSEPLMNWDQIRELSKNDLVEIVSHSYDLHKGIQYNSQGNIGAAAHVRAYLVKEKRYETEVEFRERIRKDFIAQKQLFKKQLGFGLRNCFGEY